MHSLRAVLLAGILYGGVTGCGPGEVGRDPLDPRDVSLLTLDGARITATFYPSSRPHPAALILVHMLGSGRASFRTFAQKAQHEGYASIAFDMRGHGGSTGPNGAPAHYRQFNQAAWLGVLNDLDAAKSALLQQGADPNNLAIIGASIGANLALRFAAGQEDIQAVVLLSPGLVYQGVEAKNALLAYGRRPLLLLTTTGDTYATASCETLRGTAPGQCELREYEGSAHGTDILDASATSQDQILLWLSSIIGPGAASANRGMSSPLPERESAGMAGGSRR